MRTKPTFRLVHSASLTRPFAAQFTVATVVKVMPSVLVEMVAAVMSPSVELVRFHCFGRYSSVETLLHTPPRSIVIVCGSTRFPPQVDQQVSSLLSLKLSIARYANSPGLDRKSVV